MTWRHLQSDNIEFTIKRLREPIDADNRPGAEGEWEMMARVGKRKIGTWSYKQQRELIKLAAASQSLETIANRMGRPTATILKKAAQLGISIKRQKAPP